MLAMTHNLSKEKKLIHYVACGMGAPSCFLAHLAGHKVIAATHIVVANTGSEKDRRLHDGSKITADEFVENCLRPFCAKFGLPVEYVRACNRQGEPLPPLWDYIKQAARSGKLNKIPIPLYGSRQGQLTQSCTEKWKVRAMDQWARREGATELISAQGLHYGEPHRISGRPIDASAGFQMYQTQRIYKVHRPVVDLFGERHEVSYERRAVRWKKHYYPLIDFRLDRRLVEQQCKQYGVPYLITSECDHCPHKDRVRWERTSPQTINEIAALEAQLNGEFFFADRRKPLPIALAEMQAREDLDVGCREAFCFT